MAGAITQAGIQGGLGTVGLAFSIASGLKWDKAMSELKDQDPSYTSSPYAANNLGFAQTLLNSRMAGAQARANNIQTSGANARAGITRGTTDSSQALALMSGIQGQEGNQYNDLALQEGQDAIQKQNNLFNANKDMTVEGDKLFDDSVRRWQDQVNIITAQYKARKQGGKDISDYGAAMGSSIGGAVGGGGGGAGGGAGGMFGMSDKRLKHNYHIVGKSPSGINIYEFSYLGSSIRYIGAMANEVPQAAFMTDSGFYAVDYSKIDVQFKQIS